MSSGQSPNWPGDGTEARPDGRTASQETLKLRLATRALRVHLDAMPVDYRLDVTADRFLAGLAFMSARHRYDCAESMIGAGFGGTVLGSISRSLFIDGLRWMWIGEVPERRRHLLGDLIEQRNRICIELEKADATCPILSRWLMPLPDVADLTGQSLAWLDVQPMPSEEELLDGYLAGADAAAPPPATSTAHATLTQRAMTLLDMTGLRGAVMVLAHAGHGNYLGLQSSLTREGAAGHDLRADHEALFMHVAAVGVTATLLGAAVAVPDLWPPDVAQEPFLQTAVDLAEDVTKAASAIHRLASVGSSAPKARKKIIAQRAVGLLRPEAVLATADLLPDIQSIVPVATAAEEYYEVVQNMLVGAWDYGTPMLHTVLAYGGGHSGLQAVMSTYDQPGSEVITVFAARMLLEEAARLVWRFSDPDESVFKARAKQFFDEYRARRRKAIDALTGSGVAKTDAERIFALPDNIIMSTPLDDIAKNREPILEIGSLLSEMGASFSEPGWLEVAYSMLSQITHSTPIGHMHTIRVRNGEWSGGELSPEMLSLALDTACLGSAYLIGTSVVLLTRMSPQAMKYRRDLLQAARVVHYAAQLIHGLD